VICRAFGACDSCAAVAAASVVEMVLRSGLLPYERVCSLLTRGHHLGRVAECGSASSASKKGSDIIVRRELAGCFLDIRVGRVQRRLWGRTFINHGVESIRW
jgi:hypothetical protein